MRNKPLKLVDVWVDLFSDTLPLELISMMFHHQLEIPNNNKIGMKIKQITTKLLKKDCMADLPFLLLWAPLDSCCNLPAVTSSFVYS